MTTLIIPINKNAQSYSAGISKIALNSDAQIYVGITKSQASNLHINMQNVTITIFEDNSEIEEMLNSMQAFLTEGKVIICRRPISYEEFLAFNRSKADICYCKKGRQGKIMDYLKSFWQMLERRILGVKAFDGDTSIIAFGENVSALLAKAGNFSFATRVDRWKGLSQEQIEVVNAPSKIELNKKNIAMLISATIIPLLIGIILTVILSLFVKISLLVGLMLAFLDILSLGISFISIIALIFILKVGQKNYKKAKIVEYNVEEENEKG